MIRCDRYWRLILAASACCVPLTTYAQENIATKAASANAPQAVSRVNEQLAPAALLPSPNAEALRNRKQQRLREHMRPIPIGALPPVVVAMAAPQPETESRVMTPVPAAESQDVVLLLNRALTDTETSNMTSTVAEPSVAVRGNEILVTSNWFASFSRDGGVSFQFVNPFTTFPSSPQGDFCCDQIAFYDRQHDLMIWILQYVSDDSGNTLRVAVAAGNDIAQQNWRYYDFTPQTVGNWAQEWFDYPDVVVGSQFLYLTSNVFKATGAQNFTRSVLLRLPLQQLAAYQQFDYQYFDSEELGGLRCTQGGTDTMYFAAHSNPATLRVLTWPENSTAIQQKDVTVQQWNPEGHEAIDPDGRDWLGRCDGRITAAWQSGNQIGFAWTAAQDANFNFPHVRVAILDRSSMQVVQQPHIWNNDFAFAYPSAAPNGAGRIGVSLHYGGGASARPSHSIGALTSAGSWSLVTTSSGSHGPEANSWGDYGGVRVHGADPQIWVATGYTLDGGANEDSIAVRVIQFRLQP